MDCSPPGSSVRGILQQEHWIAMEWIAMLSSEIHHASHQKYLISFCRFRKCLFFLTSALRVVPHKSCTFQSSRHQMPPRPPAAQLSHVLFALPCLFMLSPKLISTQRSSPCGPRCRSSSTPPGILLEMQILRLPESETRGGEPPHASLDKSLR